MKKSPIEITILIVVLLIIFTAFIAFLDHRRVPIMNLLSTQSQPSEAAQQSTISETAIADFSFNDLSGRPYRLSDFKGQGRHVFINFWASWCAPCVKEFPILIEAAHEYGDQWTIIAFSVDEQPQQAQEFLQRFRHLQKFNGGWPQNIIFAADHDKAVSKDIFQTIRYPESYILTPDLYIKRKIVGLVTADDFILTK